MLESLGNINDQAILDITDTEINSIVTSPDNSLFLWAKMEYDFDLTRTLNIPSIKKLSNVIDMVSEDEIEFKLNSNNLEYKNKKIKFKYHLLNDGIINKPKISTEKIESFTYDVEIEFESEFIKSILKSASVFKDTKKLYLYTEEDELIWSLADRTMTNSDSFSVSSGEVDFELDPFILNLDNLKLVSFGKQSTIKLRINNSIGFGNLQIFSDDLEMNYIVTSLTK